MAIAVVTSALFPTGVTGATSAALDTTGASLLVIGVASYILPTVSDSKGNTWTGLTSQSTGAADEGRTQLFYVANPTVGASHTFDWAYAGYGNTTAIVMAFSGVATASPFVNENGFATNSSVNTIQPGSITPSEDNCLVLTMAAFTSTMTSGTGAINGGFTIQHQRNFTTNNTGGQLAYLIQTSAAAANPTITAPTGSGPMSAVIASFKSAGGGGGGVQLIYNPLPLRGPLLAQ